MGRRGPGGRQIAAAALALVLLLLVLQLSGLWDVDRRLDSTSIFLVLLAALLALALVSPKTVAEILSRIEGIKLPGGFEIALARIESLSPTPSASRIKIDGFEISEQDAVSVSSRPKGDGAGAEYRAVQEKLQQRLRFIRDALLELDEGLGYEAIVSEIAQRGLLEPDETQTVLDLLRRDGDEIEELPPELLDRYLDSGWRFAVRLGTLIFERHARGLMIAAGWFLLDFEQARSHRPDFLAYHRKRWLLVATRVEPTKTRMVRRRLSRTEVPFDALPLLVVPDSRAWAPSDDPEPGVAVMTISATLAEF